jgi:hypothetical protein
MERVKKRNSYAFKLDCHGLRPRNDVEGERNTLKKKFLYINYTL